MKCEKCGTENLEGSTYCKKCKTVFSEKEEMYNSSTKQLLDRKIEDKSSICKCGQKLESDWSYCPNCHLPRAYNYKKNDLVKGKDKSSVIYVVIYCIGILSALVLQFYWGILVAIIAAVTGRIKNPDSMVFKILLWGTIVMLIVITWFLIFIIQLCESCRHMPG